MCEELEIAQTIDRILPAPANDLSHGQVITTLILNGLGFVNRQLYLVPQFFKNKPLARLLGEGIEAEQLNDGRLGRTLEAIYQFGTTALFSEVARQAAQLLKLSSRFLHLDSTSFHTHGQYLSDDSASEGVISITKGYSRDHRPELNQFILNMIVDSQAAIPLHMEAASGNSSDKTDFPRIIEAHIAQLQSVTEASYIVSDSALYVEASLQRISETTLWISRVPETIKGVRQIYESVDLDAFQRLDANYQILELGALCTRQFLKN